MLVAASAYIVIILLIWGMFAFSSGLPYETAFTYVSETSSGLKGFFMKRTQPGRIRARFTMFRTSLASSLLPAVSHPTSLYMRHWRLLGDFCFSSSFENFCRTSRASRSLPVRLR